MNSYNESRCQTVQLIWQMEPYLYIRHKDFYKIYKKYAVARIYWALLRQAAQVYSYDDFYAFYIQHRIKAHIKQLFLYRDCKVAISSILCGIAPFIFYFLAKNIRVKQ